MTIAAPIEPKIVPAGSDRELRCNAAELRATKTDGKTVLAGYAAVYDQRSAPIYGIFYEVVRRGAFARALAGTDDVRALFDHDSSMVLGRTRSKTLSLSEDEKGLKFELTLPDTSVGRDLAQLVERRDISEMSFGFRKIKDRWTEETNADGLMITTRELLEVELFDVSPVAYPAYPQTDVAVRSLQEFRQSKTASGQAMRAARLRLASAFMPPA